MATLTTSFQRIGVGPATTVGQANGYLEVWAKYNSQNIANNTTNYTVELRLVVTRGYFGNYQSTPFSVSGTDISTYNGDIGSGSHTSRTLGSTSGTVTHNSSGAKSITGSGTLNLTAWGITLSASGSADLPPIPRQANLVSAQDFTDEENPTVTYSNPAGNSVNELVVSIYNTAGSIAYAPYRAVNKTETLSYTFNLTNEERTALRQACTGNSMAVRFYLRTYLGGTYYYSYLQKTMTIVNGNPTFSDFTFADTNPTTVALTGNNQNIIKGYSNVTATISTANKAIANKEATMSKYSFMCGNLSTDVNYSDNSDVSITLNKVPNGLFNVFAIDSRNNSKMVSKLANQVIDYSDITKGNISVTRSNGVSKGTTLAFNGTWWNNSFAQQSTNLRHIQLGDDLSGKTLYFRLPDNVHQSIISDPLDRADECSVIANTIYGKSNIYETYTTSTYSHSAFLKLRMWDYEQQISDETTIYEAIYESGTDTPTETINTNLQTLQLPDDFGVVDYIDDTTATYQYIYIGEEIPNTISASYKYKKTSESSYPQTSYPLILTTSGNNYSFSGLITGDEGAEGFDINYSYDIQVIVEDELSNVTFTTQLASGIPHIAYAKDGVGIMGKYDTSVGGALQVEGQPVPKALSSQSNSQTDTYNCYYLNKKMLWLYKTTRQNIPAQTATHVIFEAKSDDSDDRYPFTYDELGNITVGQGVTKVFVEAAIRNITTGSDNYIYICKNDITRMCYNQSSAGQMIKISGILNVQKGDVISIKAYTNITSTLQGDGSADWDYFKVTTL